MSEDQPPVDDLVAGRRQHYARLVEIGLPTRYERSHLAAELQEIHGDLEPGAETDDRVSVAGRVMLRRSFGKLLFLTVADVSGSIQVFVERGSVGDEAFTAATEIDLGDWVGVTGEIMTTKKGELSVRPGEVSILQKSLRPLPDKWHGLTDIEARSRRRYLDLIANPESRRVALARARIVSDLRRQFEARGFVEVETPVLLTQATGALARPFVTHHNALDIELQLRIATELYLKRLVVGGVEKVFEIGRIFRNEGIDSTHNPEFTMLEAYVAFADYHDIMALVEEIISAVAESAWGGTRSTYQGRDLAFDSPFERVSLIDLVSGFVGEKVDLDTAQGKLAGMLFERGVTVDSAWGPGKLLFELYELAHKEIWQPTFVLDFPTDVSPLARKSPQDPRVTERFQLVIAGAEYCNAFSELNDADDQRSRFEAQAAARAGGDESAHAIDHDYIEALEYGLPPTGGLGIGVDRLVMLLTDQSHIRDVILFPTLKPATD